jgi:phosphopantetheine adenylyltransferase
MLCSLQYPKVGYKMCIGILGKTMQYLHRGHKILYKEKLKETKLKEKNGNSKIKKI